MIKSIEVDERFKEIRKVDHIYKFLNPDDLLPEQYRDPDYRMKFIERTFGNMNPISCSKCHHCR